MTNLDKQRAQTLFLVAHRTGARLLLQPAGGPLRMLDEINHPQGNLRDLDRDADRPGRTHDSGGIRHAFEHHVPPHEHIAQEFARDLAAQVRDLRLAHRYGDLVLVAAPHFLGLLRAALDEATAKTVRATVPHDYAHLPTAELGERLKDVL